MTWLNLWQDLVYWLIPLLAGLHILFISATFLWILMNKTESQSAVAWCLIVFFVPYLGALFFFLFGYQHVHRPLQRKRQHMEHYRQTAPGPRTAVGELPAEGSLPQDEPLNCLQRLADRVGAYPLTFGNQIDFYHEGPGAFEDMLTAIRSARHHVHLEFFIVQPDELGRTFIAALAEKARAGVQVRLLYDAMGSHRLTRKTLEPLWRAGGKSSVFLPLSPLRRRMQVNMRNHRKILVVDGVVGFVGGLNIGDEYIGKDEYLGYRRDTHLRIRGPSVAHLQRAFCEDWDFAAREFLADPEDAVVGRSYFLTGPGEGTFPAQIIGSGPDRDLKTIREMYFAGIIEARKRVWIASPYFVPDPGILDALRLSAHLGVDVRFLGQFRPDKWVPQFAAQYYWTGMLEAGVKIYQYSRGMMHSKVMIIDDNFASVGTANLDYRSLHLNFEINCMLYSADAVKELAHAYERDLEVAIQLDAAIYAGRPLATRLLENAFRLMSPVL